MATITPHNPADYLPLIEQFAAEPHSAWGTTLKDSPTGLQMLAAPAPAQRAIVLAAITWLNKHDPSTNYLGYSRVSSGVLVLMRRKLPFDHDDMLTLLSWVNKQGVYWGSTQKIIKALETYLKDHPLTPALQEHIIQLVETLGGEGQIAQGNKRVAHLRELGGVVSSIPPLIAGDAWAAAAISKINSMEGEQRQNWIGLLAACAQARGSAPSAAWRQTVTPLLEAIGLAAFKTTLLAWFPLVDKPRTPPYEEDATSTDSLILNRPNADILKALVWLCAQHEDKELARALGFLALSAYRKLPGVGPRCVRVGNACLWALGNMPGMAGIEQLALLKVKVSFGTPQKRIATSLATAAQRVGLTPAELEELSIPDYGMQAVGLRREHVGEWVAELRITGNNTTELTWLKPDGTPQRSVPQAVKSQHPQALKELTQVASDIRKMLPAQRARLESFYLTQAAWPFPIWCARYLNHPLLGTLTRRLIWYFQRGDQTASAIWFEGQLVGHDGHPLGWLNETTQVSLWHPLHQTIETTTAWRDWLTIHQVQQPFKQAHREIYLLTDAERTTRVYSNRFAAHILKQHQFNALCSARGWKNRLRLMVDDTYPPAMRLLPHWDLRAEFWIEAIGGDYRMDTTESGTYFYVTTDQVRFYALNAAENWAHALGGGYRSNGQTAPTPVPLAEIPPRLFSEIMRDVDLFVGVASVGNDPHWREDAQAGHRAYWTDYAFGDLTETAKTRQYVLERLVPRLKIADRCHLAERFLVVRGDLRTYKIHLGSGNILMEPNDQYLCIVPARSSAATGVDSKIFLPFEGDATLSLIISKAFLLAADRQITDPTITRQIGYQEATTPPSTVP